ncbi:MAG: plastocyanin/azurin family copper-binding protein [Candidatus Paceibacterota bacterium]
MKYIVLIVIFAVLIGGWYMWTNEAEAPVIDETNSIDQMDQEDEVNNDIPNLDDNSESESIDAQDQFKEVGDDSSVEEDISNVDDGQQVTKEDDVKVFNISAENFTFDVTEMRVQEGDTVTINFTVTEGLHDLVIDEFDVATPQMTANGQSSVTFVADAAGTYEYYCSVGSHRAMGMVGSLIVE